MQPRRTQAERTDATRALLVATAKRLFVAQGFVATGTPQIVAEAQVTRGALYHHFADKADLLMAVALEMADEVAAKVRSSAPGDASPTEQLLQGARAYFTEMSQGGRARILLIEAPTVLTADQLRTLSQRAGEQALREGLKAACQRSAREAKAPVNELTALLSAAFDRAALDIAHGASSSRYLQAMRFLLERVADA
jgi:AcrR family transcriptional regulator